MSDPARARRRVEADDVGSRVEDVLQRREAGAGVVDGEADPERAQVVQSLAEVRVVVDPDVLSQLEDAPRRRPT
jgi:hypothetical protein